MKKLALLLACNHKTKPVMVMSLISHFVTCLLTRKRLKDNENIKSQVSPYGFIGNFFLKYIKKIGSIIVEEGVTKFVFTSLPLGKCGSLFLSLVKNITFAKTSFFW